jgi:hypothetical protein
VAAGLALRRVVGLRRWVVTWRRFWRWVALLGGGESTRTPWLGPSVGVGQGLDGGDGSRALVVVVVVVMGRELRVTNV